MINEQELFDRFDRIAEALERMATGVDRSTESIDSETTARREYTAEELERARKERLLFEQTQREKRETEAKVKKSFDDLGASIKFVREGNEILGKIERQRVTQDNLRKKAEEELNKALEENDSVYRSLTESGKQRYKAELRNEAAMTKAYAAIGRTIDQYGKVTKETDNLTAGQRVHLSLIKKMDEVQGQMVPNIVKLGMSLGSLAIKSTFDLFAAGIKGAYAGTIAYQDAILEGAGANTAAAAQVAAQMDALASSIEATGSSMISLGAETAKTAFELILFGGPLSALVGVIMLLVGAAIAYEGYEKQSQAAQMKRDAELQKKQAAIYDELYKDFTQLSQASLTGAGGMTELWTQMNKVGMSVKDFAKFNRILVESASAMATFGNSAVEGVKKFTDVAGSVIRSGFGDVFRAMGMTNEDMADHTAKYMEQQARLGLLQGKSVADLQKGTANYIYELDRVATLTGQSRKEQEKAREAVRQIQQLRAAEFIAREKGDKGKAEELAQVAKNAAALMRSDPQLATGYVKAKVGSAIDQDVVMAMRMLPQALKSNAKDTASFLTVAGKDIRQGQLPYAELMKLIGPIAGISNMLSDDLVLQTQGINKLKEDKENKGEEFDPVKYLDDLRKVTDPFTIKQAKLQQEALETQIAFQHNVAGLSTAMPNVLGEALKSYVPEAFQKPLQEFLDHIIKFGNAVATFAGHPIDSIKDFFTGKTKAQRDAEELQEVSNKIEGLKKALGNPDEAKKLAEDNLKLAKKEFEEKDKAVTDLNIAYNKERDINKKKEIEQKQILAEDAREAARRKKEMAETSLSDAEKVKRFNNPEKFKQELMGLEARQKELKAGGATSGASAGSVGGSVGGGGGASALSGGSVISSSNAQLAAAGLRLKQGDTQKAGAKIDPKLLEMAEKAQKNIPGFNYFSAFNDDYHQENTPNSRHTKGLAFDFTVNPGRGLTKPTKEQSDLIIGLLKSYGAENVKNEYEDTSGKFRTGGHFHAELPLPKAFDGGVFDGPKGGYPVELHGREAIIPMPNPGDKLSIDKAQKDGSVSKGALSSIVADNTTNSNNGSSILIDLYSMMEEKFDDLIEKMDTNNKYTDKILKYSQV